MFGQFLMFSQTRTSWPIELILQVILQVEGSLLEKLWLTEKIDIILVLLSPISSQNSIHFSFLIEKNCHGEDSEGQIP